MANVSQPQGPSILICGFDCGIRHETGHCDSSTGECVCNDGFAGLDCNEASCCPVWAYGTMIVVGIVINALIVYKIIMCSRNGKTGRDAGVSPSSGRGPYGKKRQNDYPPPSTYPPAVGNLPASDDPGFPPNLQQPPFRLSRSQTAPVNLPPATASASFFNGSAPDTDPRRVSAAWAEPSKTGERTTPPGTGSEGRRPSMGSQSSVGSQDAPKSDSGERPDLRSAARGPPSGGPSASEPLPQRRPSVTRAKSFTADSRGAASAQLPERPPRPKNAASSGTWTKRPVAKAAASVAEPPSQVQAVEQKLRLLMDKPILERKKAYRELLLEHHPDKSDNPEAKEIFQAVNGARDWFLRES